MLWGDAKDSSEYETEYEIEQKDVWIFFAGWEGRRSWKTRCLPRDSGYSLLLRSSFAVSGGYLINDIFFLKWGGWKSWHIVWIKFIQLISMEKIR